MVCQEKFTVTIYGEWGFSSVEMRITLIYLAYGR